MSEPKTAEVKVVPVEPTEAMLDAVSEAWPRSHPSVFPIIWSAMLAASPPAETGEGSGTPFQDAEIEEAAAALSAQPVSLSEAEAWQVRRVYEDSRTAKWSDTEQPEVWRANPNYEVRPLYTHPAPDQSDTERMRALREGWAAEMFDAGHTVSQRSWTDADVTEEQRDNYRRAVDRKVEKILAALSEKAADK